ncbi:DUF4003 family protein [Aquibacillus rhizosphaerae]|uniref:DUF4003 family protein n=1 Tax=Aquibacillus rhizosphaerae TaxID=3051431 RepID=A0ABT7LB21_9BACI|nr:DUF4003 family protein [Aquibacillus sp. LR5S19]MDL4843056.1 DUF4003 family protein [Aquibacillus sp. LR5S19]
MQKVQAKLDQYKQTYAQLKKELKWRVSDNRILMMISALYVVNNRRFEFNQFNDVSEYIKRNVGMFSTLKSQQRYTTAAMLDVRYQNPTEKFQEMIMLYEQLVDSKFKRGSFTYIAALVLLGNGEESSNRQNQIEKALAIYKGMKQEHVFLTTQNDYPLAVLLSQLDGSVEDLMIRVEKYYNELSQLSFTKGNDLQFLSHILSIDSNAEAKVLIERCENIYGELKRQGIKPKAANYPQIGMLSLLEDSRAEVSLVVKTVDQLNQDKTFKWHKEINFMMAVNLVISEKLTNNELLETGLYTTIETIIQAQQATMIAGVAAVSVASNNTSS